MFTETFIEKVSKADDIQELWKPEAGDWVVDPEIDYTFLIYVKDKEHRKYLKKWNKWLPTLDDLFEIVNTASWNIPEILYTLSKRNTGLDKLHEELLDLIMEFWHDKFWNGKEWEEINGS